MKEKMNASKSYTPSASAIADALSTDSIFQVSTATMDEHGLTEKNIAKTDVLFW